MTNLNEPVDNEDDELSAEVGPDLEPAVREAAHLVDPVVSSLSADPVDAQLLMQARRGDVAALDQFFERHQPQFQRIAARELGRHDADAPSVVQSVFVTVRKEFHNCRGETAKKCHAWIAEILRNRARARLKLINEAVQLDSSDGMGDSLVRDVGPGPRTVLMNRELKQRVEQAIQILLPSDGEVVRLHFFEKLPFREIAVRLGHSEAAVKQRCSRAIQKLRNCLCDASGSIPNVPNCAMLDESCNPSGGRPSGGRLR